jgi:hypothetical protein
MLLLFLATSTDDSYIKVSAVNLDPVITDVIMRTLYQTDVALLPYNAPSCASTVNCSHNTNDGHCIVTCSRETDALCKPSAVFL